MAFLFVEANPAQPRKCGPKSKKQHGKENNIFKACPYVGIYVYYKQSYVEAILRETADLAYVCGFFLLPKFG